MAIEFNVNGEIKTAKDIYVGANSAKHKVIKIITSVNGEKYAIYDETGPSLLHGFFYKARTGGFLTETDDFVTKESITDVVIDYIFYNKKNQKIYAFKRSENNSIADHCYIVDKNKEVIDNTLTYHHGSSYSRMYSMGYLNGVFYQFVNLGYMYYSFNGYDWYLANINVPSSYIISGYFSNWKMYNYVSDETNSFLIGQFYSYQSSTRKKTTYVYMNINAIENNSAPSSPISLSVTSITGAIGIGCNISKSIVYAQNGTAGCNYEIFGDSVIRTNYQTSDFQAMYPRLYKSGNYFGYNDASNGGIYFNTTKVVNISSNVGGISMCETPDGVDFFYGVSGGWVTISNNGIVTNHTIGETPNSSAYVVCVD